MDIGIVGLGAIGGKVAAMLAAGRPNLRLVAVAGRDPARTAGRVAELGLDVPVLALGDLVRRCETVVDCATSASLRDIALATFGAGRTLVTVNAAALLDNPDLAAIAGAAGGRLVVATGALLALDAVAAAAVGEIRRVTMRNRKPPRSLAGAPYVVAAGIDLDAIRVPTCIFSGTARDAARGFPANVNVAAALSLAGIGPDRTDVEIWADPTISRNIHEFDLESDSVSLTVRTEGLPSPDNPKTSAIVPLSVVATLDRLAGPVRIGT
ncbi:MAG: aspartate dehydrogenase [Proteobacteria bacterium]|nr:aspartate dehydrogenase [Pseudomonadota bacterium]